MASNQLKRTGLYEGPSVPDDEVLSVYVVLNGTLPMTHGKMASQSFQAAIRLMTNGHLDQLSDWLDQGRRVVVRVAETPHTFQRVCDECEGWKQFDEGLTEVERGSITAFVTLPYRRADVPKILRHTRVQLY